MVLVGRLPPFMVQQRRFNNAGSLYWATLLVKQLVTRTAYRIQYMAL